MTRYAAARIAAQWPLLVIVATIFMAGWGIKAALSSEINGAALAVEARVNTRQDERLAPLKETVMEMRVDLRAIREALAPLTFHKAGP